MNSIITEPIIVQVNSNQNIYQTSRTLYFCFVLPIVMIFILCLIIVSSTMYVLSTSWFIKTFLNFILFIFII